MALERVERFAARVVAAQPDPPRRVPLAAVLARAHGSQQNLVLIAAAAVFVTSAVWFERAAGADGDAVVTIAFALAAAAALGGIVEWARRVAWALRRGLLATARIDTVHKLPPGPLHARSLDAMSNGFAFGVRRVEHLGGGFREEFRTAASWAAALREGDHVEVVVHPRRSQVLLEVRRLPAELASPQ